KMKDGKKKNVMPVSTAEYNSCGWRAWLNNTTLTLGLQNVFESDAAFVAGSFENGYDESLATIRGRFWYLQLKKRFRAAVLPQIRYFGANDATINTKRGLTRSASQHGISINSPSMRK